MFYHNFKYSLKVLFKNKILLFWTFLFPLLLGVFFNMAFSDIEKNEKLNIINIAVVKNKYYDDNKIIGYYSLSLQDNNECEINNLCVLPQYRHKHIGAMLLENAYIKAKEMGYKKMSIGIIEENKILRKWYEDNGFIHIGTKKFDFFPFTCGYMKRDL